MRSNRQLGKGYRRIASQRATAFTLVELMAVMLVILILSGVALKTAGYIQQRTGIQRTKAELAAIANALETYKSDTGIYPPSSADGKRLSNIGAVESRNNYTLYWALSGSGKSYLKFPASRLRISPVTGLMNIFDDFDKPYVYYNAPTNSYAVLNIYTNLAYTVGGQVNKLSYDLFSFGPDQMTYIAPYTLIVGNTTNTIPADSCACGTGAWANSGPGGRFRWDSAASANDDIVNWNK